MKKMMIRISKEDCDDKYPKKEMAMTTNLGRNIPNRCSRDDLPLLLKNSSEEATVIEPIKV